MLGLVFIQLTSPTLSNSTTMQELHRASNQLVKMVLLHDILHKDLLEINSKNFHLHHLGSIEKSQAEIFNFDYKSLEPFSSFTHKRDSHKRAVRSEVNFT